MALREIETIRFIDADSGQQAIAIVRAGDGLIALCLSLEEDGDVEVIFRSSECKQLQAALEQALSIMNS